MAGRYLIERGHREMALSLARWNVTPAQAVLLVL